MSTKTYSEKLKDPRWQKKRLEILKRDKFTCKKCKDDTTTLHVHHLEYNNCDPWGFDNSKLVTLCEDCHKTIEKLKKDKLFKDVEFKDIYIRKESGWSDDSIIMFTSINGVCAMEIFDENRNFIIGYNIPGYRVREVIKILKKAL